MENVLDLYEEPYDPKRPVVGFDERPTQLFEEVREPLPAKPKEVSGEEIKAGSVAKQDYEYERKGVENIFMFFEPLGGWRHIEVFHNKTKQDFAKAMKYLCEQYPDAEVIRVVIDNYASHSKGALYEAFPAEEAHRLLKKLEFHYTPKHGSWLNVAEIELSVLVRQSLKGKRLGTAEALKKQSAFWEKARNEKGVPCDWQFKTKDARIKLKRLYPIIANSNG